MKKLLQQLKTLNQHGLLAGLLILALLLPTVAFVASVNTTTITSSKAATVTYYSPNITSVPPQSITEGQQYSYKIVATDPQNLPLNYGVLTQPIYKEVSISGNTITAKFDKPGVYPLVLYVTNGHRSVPQAFTITVQPAVKTDPNNGSGNGKVQAATAPTVSFTAPVAGTVFGGPQNKITWSANSSVGISKVDLYYSIDRVTWKEIVKSYTGNSSSYTWDTTNISDGKYYLRIDVTDRSQSPLTTSLTSSQFEIKNPIKNNTNYTEADKPRIVGSYQPAENDTIFETTPIIKIDYEGGNSDIDTASVKVKIDGNDVTADVGPTSLSYKVTEALSTGSHTVNVTLKNKKGLERNVEWAFSIIPNPNPDTNTNTGSTTQTVLGLNPILGTGIIIVLIFLVVLLVIFAIFKLIEIIKGKQREDEITQITNYYSPQPTGPESVSTTYTTETTTQTDQPSTDQYNPYVTNNYYVPTEPVGAADFNPTAPVVPETTDYQNAQTTQTVETTTTNYSTPDESHFYGNSTQPVVETTPQYVQPNSIDQSQIASNPYFQNPQSPIDYNANPNTFGSEQTSTKTTQETKTTQTSSTNNNL